MSEQTNPQPTAAPQIDDDPAATDVVATDAGRDGSSTSGGMQAQVNDDPAAMDVVPTDAGRDGSSTSGEVQAQVNDDPAAMDVVPTTLGDPSGPSKGRVTLVHLYPREMSIYGDLGNTRCLEARLRWHGYEPNVVSHNPGDELPDDIHLVVGGGGQDSGQARVEADLERIGPRLVSMAEDGVPMLMICGMYQLFGKAFRTVEGETLPGLGILEVTTQGNAKRMIGPVVLSTEFGDVVGYENHSGSTVLGDGQRAFGDVRSGFGNNGEDGKEGARTHNVIGSYLHGPILPSNPKLADFLIAVAAERATGRPFEPGEIDDHLADEARTRQVARLTKKN